MNLWEKINGELNKGAEIASNRVAYTTKLAQLNWEERNVKNSMNDELEELGKLLFQLNDDKNLVNLSTESQPSFEKLASYETELENKESEKNELAKVYGMETIDKGIVKELRHDLEDGGGTIMQVVVSDTSSFLNKKLKEIKLPKDALIGTIVRDENVIVPDGNTMFKAGDKVTLLGKREDVEKAIQQITK